MRCHQTELRLQELLDNRQQVKGDPQLAEHLAECGECATLAAAYEQMADCFCAEDAQLQQYPGGLGDQVLEALNTPASESAVVGREPATRTHWKRWAGLAIAASVAIAVVMNYEPAANNPADSPVAVPDVTDPQDTQPAMTFATEQPRLPGGMVWYQTGQRLASISLVDLSRRYYTSTEAEPANDEAASPWSFPTDLPDFWPTTEPSPSPDGTGQFVRSISYAMV